MKYLLVLCVAVLPSVGRLLAEDEKAEESAPPAATTAPVEESRSFTGSVSAGYRWQNGPQGNNQVYRSIVDVGEGPRLIDFDFRFRDSSKRLLESADISAMGWGGDPSRTLRFDFSRSLWYRFTATHRDFAYFNSLPWFANPQASTGLGFSQNSYDMNRRMTDVRLELLPGRRFVPFFEYTRDSGSGTGITDFAVDANSYAVASRLSDRTHHFRGGVRAQLGTLHLTLEQGASKFRDGLSVFNTDRNTGNLATPFLGRPLYLNGLAQVYGATADSSYSAGSLGWSPVHWLDMHGRFVYSLPESSVNYSQESSGQLLDLSRLLFADRQRSLVESTSKQPHSLGAFEVEVRPLRRLRIVESWLTDRLHNAAFVQSVEEVFAPRTEAIPDRLSLNQSTQQIDVIFDVTRALSVRGGYRYTWGDASLRSPMVRGAAPEFGETRLHTALGAVNYRLSQKLRVDARAEVTSGDRSYFRTSLRDFQKVTTRARYELTRSLALAARASWLSNDNPTAGAGYDFRSRDLGASIIWNPAGGKRVSVLAEYSRPRLSSTITYLVPNTLQREVSSYRSHSHVAAAAVDLRSFTRWMPALSLGGSLVSSGGSLPTTYYQPDVRASLPLARGFEWIGQWRWYGFGQRFYTDDGFRTHQVLTGFRLTR